jgi:SAM-dependent methyltransferase
MDSSVKNLLYDHPEYYEFLHPELQDETPSMCRRIFARYLKEPPTSILDIGCGTGRDLRSLRKTCPNCVGVDFLPQMIEYATTRSSEVGFLVGDMRTLRLGMSFDVVLCFGSTLMYALTNADIDRTVDTFAAHCHPGSLLILDTRNAAAFLGDGFTATVEGEVRSTPFCAHYVAEHTFDRRRQILIRRRTWQMENGTSAQDYCEYRLFFPKEIEHLLSSRGFRVLGVYDNKDLRETDFTGSTMYTIAEYGAEPAGAGDVL